MKRLAITLIPFGRYFIGKTIEQLDGGVIFKNLNPLLKRINSPDRFIGRRSRGESTFGEVRKGPFDAVEAEAGINHDERIVLCSTGACKHNLATIAVASPFVEHKHRDKFRIIYDFLRWEIGQKTLDLDRNADTVWSRLRRKTRAKTRSWTTGNIHSPDLNCEIFGMLDENLGDIHDRAFRNRQA